MSEFGIQHVSSTRIRDPRQLISGEDLKIEPEERRHYISPITAARYPVPNRIDRESDEILSGRQFVTVISTTGTTGAKQVQGVLHDGSHQYAE